MFCCWCKGFACLLFPQEYFLRSGSIIKYAKYSLQREIYELIYFTGTWFTPLNYTSKRNAIEGNPTQFSTNEWWWWWTEARQLCIVRAFTKTNCLFTISVSVFSFEQRHASFCCICAYKIFYFVKKSKLQLFIYKTCLLNFFLISKLISR